MADNYVVTDDDGVPVIIAAKDLGGGIKAVVDASHGPVAPGAAAPNSSLVAGIYSAGGVTPTDGEQVALQTDNTGALRVAGSFTSEPPTINTEGPVTPGSPAIKSGLMGGQYNATAPTLTDGQQVAIQLDTNGALKVSVAAGGIGGGAMTVANGADVAQGTTTDAAWSSGSGTIVGILKGIFGQLAAVVLGAGSAIIGKVGIDQSTPGSTNKVSIGTDGSVAINAALPDGTNLIGQVIINQSIPGTSNKVSIGTDGTVTANAGTDLNTSELALESGGNLATIAGAVSSSKVAVKSADGDFATLGTSTDSANAATDSTAVSAISVLKQISKSVQASEAGTAVTIADGADNTLGSRDDAASGAVDSTPASAISILKMISLKVQALVIGAGSAIIGKVGIDQTTPGYTNKVSIGSDGVVQANAGTNLNTSALALEAGGNLAILAGAVSGSKLAVKTGDGDQVTIGTKTDAANASTDGTAVSVISALKQISKTLQAGSGGGPVTIADGADTAQGTTTDGTWSSGAGTVVSILKGLYYKLGQVNLAASSAVIGNVRIDQTTPGTTNAVQDVSDGSVVPGTAAGKSALIGGQYNSGGVTLTNAQQSAAQLDNAGNLLVNVAAGGAGGGAMTVADGADTTLGAIADAAVAAGATGSLSAKLRAISRDIVANIVLAAGNALLGKVGIDQTTPGTTNKVSIGTDGTVAINAALPAGTALLGKTGIDQTTPGTTNKVSIGSDGTVGLVAGSAIVGKFGIDQTTPGTTNAVQDAADGPVSPGTAAGKSALVGGVYNSSAPTLTNGQQAAAQFDSAGNLLVNIKSGGTSGGAMTVADGADVTMGAIADAAVTAGATGSLSAKLRAISRDIVANIVLAAGSAILGKVGIDQTTPGTTNLVSIGTNGTVAINTALPAGSNIVGNVRIDQTTAGTTNGVQDAADGPVSPGTAAGKSMLSGGQYNSSAPTLTNTQQAATQMDAAGNILVNIKAGQFSGAVTSVDGGVVTVGALADAAVVAGATGSLSAKLRSISRDLVANIVLAAGSAIIGSVSINQTTPGTTNLVATGTADGSDITQGAKADTAYAGSGSASIVAALKGLYNAMVAATPAGENHMGSIGGLVTIASANFTRPSNTTAYAAAQLVANSTTAASVTPMTLAVGRTSSGTGQSGMVRRCKIYKSGTSLTNAQFRLHLYTVSTMTFANGDGSAWSTNLVANYIGKMDVTMDEAFTDGCNGHGTPDAGTEINFTTQNIYGCLSALAAYTPVSAEVFTVNLEVVNN